LVGGAAVSTYSGASGGKIVENLGHWGPGAKRNGAVTFPDVRVPADGTYTLTLYHVDSNNPSARTMTVTVSGTGAVTITVSAQSTCCGSTAIEVKLRKDTNTITIGGSDGPVPSVDRIVISMR
jgi:hypothetical protein